MRTNPKFYLAVIIFSVLVFQIVDFPVLAEEKVGSSRLDEQGQLSNQWVFDTPPTMVDSVGTVYPEMAYRILLEGTVVLLAEIDSLGVVRECIVLQSVHPLLDKAAIEAFTKSSFLPATQKGQNVDGVISVSYMFTLEEGKKTFEEMQRIRHKLANDEIRIKTKAELLELLERPESEISESFARTLSHLGPEHVELLESLLGHENERYHRWAAYGLGKIGTREAVDILILELEKHPGESMDGMYLVSAIGISGAKSALPALYDFEKRMRPINQVAADQVLFQIRRMENKDFERPLVVVDQGQLRFRFCLDEICNIYTLKERFTFVYNGYIYSKNPKSEGIRVDFPQKDMRKICDFLSDGEIHFFKEAFGYSEYLIIELCNGKHLALMKNGVEFIIAGGNKPEGYTQFSIESQALANYIEHIASDK